MDATVVTLAVVIDAVTGEPRRLYQAVPHPVTLMSRTLMWFEARLNQPHRGARWLRAAGGASMLVYIGIWVTIAALIDFGLSTQLAAVWAMVISATIGSTLLAGRSLFSHVNGVRRALMNSDLPQARSALAMIVGRDVEGLNESEVVQAATESLAENLSDGLVAPIFWYVVFGLPGLAFYKAVNTADSMIGHRTEQYLHYGWAAARLDDLLNYLPARLTALLIAIASFSKSAIFTSIECARRHPSPNAGWPEAAIAGALNVGLGGPRTYGGTVSDNAMLGNGRRTLTVSDLRSGIWIAVKVWVILLAILIAWTAVEWKFAGTGR